jgi:hypothetical protein
MTPLAWNSAMAARIELFSRYVGRISETFLSFQMGHVLSATTYIWAASGRTGDER